MFSMVASKIDFMDCSSPEAHYEELETGVWLHQETVSSVCGTE